MSLYNTYSKAINAMTSTVTDTRLSIGVTGLSRAGKTVFIVSAIQNLVAMGAGQDSLPALSKELSETAGSRLVGIEIEAPGVQNIPWFNVREHASRLGGAEPGWPDRTTDLSKLAIRLTIRRRSNVGGKLLGDRQINIEFLDYPGEWLLDLPLLRQDFRSWARDTLAELKKSPRDEAMRPFLDFLSARPAWAAADEETARKGYTLYRDGLVRCRDELGLRFLQPGRFLRPGPFGESPLMWFFPLDPGDGEPRQGTLAALLSERFEAYKADTRARFIDPYFSRFDRQVVLVDVLGALRGGRDASHDTKLALEKIAGAFRAESGFALPFRSQIQKILFVATKADHVPNERHAALRTLLLGMCKDAETPLGKVSSNITYHLAASIRCTRSGVHRVTEPSDPVMGNREFPVVIGTLLGEQHERPWYCGELPSDLPKYDSDFWKTRLLQLPQFRPPAFDALAREGIPHLLLDKILSDLIGDQL